MMRTYKGIVCEKNNNEIIFITANGEFLRGIPLFADPEIGDEVEFHLVTPPLPQKKRFKTYYAPALVAAALLIFLMTSFFSQTDSAYAYIQLQGNQSIELGINEKGTIISVQSLDDTNISHEEWQGLSIQTALSKAFKELSTDNGEIEITTEFQDDYSSELKHQIEKAVKEIKTNNFNHSNKTIENNYQNESEVLKDKTVEKQIEKEPISSVEENQKKQSPIQQPKNNDVNKNQTNSNEVKETNKNPQNNQNQKKNENTTPAVEKSNKNNSKDEVKKNQKSTSSQNDNEINNDKKY